jgi:hypothetical protein
MRPSSGCHADAKNCCYDGIYRSEAVVGHGDDIHIYCIALEWCAAATNLDGGLGCNCLDFCTEFRLGPAEGRLPMEHTPKITATATFVAFCFLAALILGMI